MCLVFLGTAYMDVKSHIMITRAALNGLPTWALDILAGEQDNIADIYSIYPDIWRWKKAGDTHDNAVKYDHYSLDDTAPYSEPPAGVCPTISGDSENAAKFSRHYIENSLRELKDNNIAEAAKYLGSYAHYLEDCGCAAHISPEVLDSLVAIEPPPMDDNREFVSLHYLFENEETPYESDLEGYKPRLLGRTVSEMLLHLQERYRDLEGAKLSAVLPYLRGLYRRDGGEAARARLVAGTVTGEVLVDFLYTLLCIHSGKFEDAECKKLNVVDLVHLAPIETVSHFCDAYFGRVIHNSSIGEFTDYGWPKIPLKLNVDGRPVEYAKGFGVGVALRLSFPLNGVFTRFKCLAGLHSELGGEGVMAFDVEVDGVRVYDSGAITAGDGAKEIDVSIKNSNILTLSTRQLEVRPGSSGRRTPDHGVWAEPTLFV